MQIDRKLNLVMPILRDGAAVAQVFHMPVAEAVFDAYYLIIAKAFTRIYAENLSFMGGPRVAAMILKDVAMSTPRDGVSSWWDGPAGVEIGLMGEIRRLTSVLTPGPGGWTPIMLEHAVNQGLLSAREASEVDGALVFFTVNWLMHKAEVARPILDAAGGMWGFQTTSSDLTAYRASLPTSTPAAATGATAKPLSIPS